MCHQGTVEYINIIQFLLLFTGNDCWALSISCSINNFAVIFSLWYISFPIKYGPIFALFMIYSNKNDKRRVDIVFKSI